MTDGGSIVVGVKQQRDLHTKFWVVIIFWGGRLCLLEAALDHGSEFMGLAKVASTLLEVC